MVKFSRDSRLSGLGLVLGATACTGELPTEDITEAREALTTVYQAEAATDIDEGVVESEHAGFTGTGYVNINNFSDTFMLHIVNAPVANATTLRVRYANGTSSSRPIAVIVNGVTAGTMTGAPTGAWTTWVTSPAISINLLAGNNDIVHSSVVSAGMPNIDRFEIAQTFTQQVQAEAATDINEGVVENEHAGFTGTGYVNINNFSDTFMFHVVNSPVTATASLRVRYANGTSSSRPIAVTVNGVGVGTVSGGPTGAWTSWVVSPPISVNLVAGNNDIVHSSVVSAGMPNIDRFDLTF
jgi:hypothetical protein